MDEVRADPEQLYRVLQNLVRNARQAFGASHGQIDIVVGEDEANWTITIRDNCPGLPPKAIEHLFHPFSGGTKRDGSGLGLAIARALLRNPTVLFMVSTSVFSQWSHGAN